MCGHMIRIVWTHDQNHVDTCLAKCGHMNTM